MIAAACSRLRHPRVLLPLLGLATALGLALSLAVGPAGLGWPRGETGRVIVLEIRLPRALLGALVGAALGLSGAVLQGHLRNPLAEPGLIGASSGAVLGAVLSIHTGLAAALGLARPLGGLIGAGAAVGLVLLLAGTRASTTTLILAGVAVSTLAAAATSLVLNLSGNPFATVEMVLWMMGSLADRSMTHVALAGPLIALGAMLLLRLGPCLEALTLGEDVAENLGFSMPATRVQVVLGVALTVGAATSVAGIVGFVGLVVPHLMRPLVAGSPRRLLPASLLAGAALILFADTGLRALEIATGTGLRLGVVTSLLGAPLFLWLVLRNRAGALP